MIAGSDSPAGEHRDSETLAASIMVPTGSMRMPVALPVPALTGRLLGLPGLLGRFGVLAGDCEWFVRDIRRGLRC